MLVVAYFVYLCYHMLFALEMLYVICLFVKIFEHDSRSLRMKFSKLLIQSVASVTMVLNGYADLNV